MDYPEIARLTVEFICLGIVGGTLKEVGKDIYEKAKSLLPDNELITLKLLEENPESLDFQNAVTKLLIPHLEAKPEVAKELTALLKQIPTAKNVSKIVIEGNKNCDVTTTVIQK
jgi:hypothetical protein